MKTVYTHIKLGVFVMAGLLFVVLLLYMIGRNRNIFGSHLTIKAVFSDANGLKAGNNVRYAGIEVGTVSYVHFLSDTSIEVAMTVTNDIANVMRRNAVASIGTDGLVGNRIVTIEPGATGSQLVQDGDILSTKRLTKLDDALQTLSVTNHDVAEIAAQLKITVGRINASQALWQLFNDRILVQYLHNSARNINLMTSHADSITAALELAMADVKNGKGLLGMFLYDTITASQMKQVVAGLGRTGSSADSLVKELGAATRDIRNEVANGRGIIHDLLKDTSLPGTIRRSLQNIEYGTDGFNQNMEALKHNFLFRGYFKKLEQQQANQKKKQGVQK